MAAVSVLLLTHDDALHQHWSGLNPESWLTVRGRQLRDLRDWAEAGHRLVVLDNTLPGLPDWHDATLMADLQALDVVVSSMRPDDEAGRQALAAGAKGYIHAYMPATALDTVLKTVHAGSVWLGPTLLARLLRQIDRRLLQREAWYEGLTQREKEVAERVAIGHSNQAIADALGITERTVRAHISAAFEKLQVTDRLMLALKVHGVGEQ